MRAGFTAPWSPETTYALMPSLTYGWGFFTWKSRSTFESFSVKSSSGDPSQYRNRRPYTSSSTETAAMDGPAAQGAITARFSVGFHDQRLRCQIVGRMSSGAGSGPRLIAVMRISTSSGDAFAYSTNTSK